MPTSRADFESVIGRTRELLDNKHGQLGYAVATVREKFDEVERLKQIVRNVFLRIDPNSGDVHCSSCRSPLSYREPDGGKSADFFGHDDDCVAYDPEKDSTDD